MPSNKLPTAAQHCENNVFLLRTHLTKKNSKELIVGKERMKELVLEEDEECGCQCAGISATHCAGHFNEVWICR